jgi:alcohol dehydrogenase class IV
MKGRFKAAHCTRQGSRQHNGGPARRPAPTDGASSWLQAGRLPSSLNRRYDELFILLFHVALRMHYDLLLPRRILFGWGRRCELPQAVKSIGKRALLVTGSRTLESNGTIATFVDSLKEAGIAVEQIAAQSREPEVADVDAAARSLRTLPVRDGDFLLAVGGGSAIDLGKAVAAMAVNRAGEGVRDYLEGVGRGLTLTVPPLPIVAVPTTAGTGSEATKNAVISSCDPPFKKSLRSEALLPQLVVVDPELTVSAPPSVTAQSGMDALTQLIESFLSRRAKPVPRALCRQGIPLALNSLVEAVEQPASRTARENMAHAAFLSGVALANSGLGMAHGVAAALGVHCRVPHGLACAVMLPAALETNRRVSLPLIAEIGRTALEGRRTSELDDEQAAESAVATIADIGRRIGIPGRLSEIGVTAERIPDLVRSSRGNSMNGNPRELSDDELAAILEGLL